MNSTKWRELANALQKIKTTGPKVRIKYLLDKDPSSGFSHLDWEWVKRGDTSIIEWLEIDPIHRTFQGMLLPDKEDDLTNPIKTTLKLVGVPFSIEGQLFKVWGHIKADSQPVLL